MHSSCSDLCPPFCKCLSTDSISVSGRHLFLYFSPQVWVPSCPPCKPSTIQGVVNSEGLAVQETWASHNFFLLILVAHLSFCPIRQMKYNLDLISPVIFLPSFMCITTREKQNMVPLGSIWSVRKSLALWFVGGRTRGDAIQMLELPSARYADVHSPRVSRWWPLWHCSYVPHARLPSLHVHALISRSAGVYSWDAAFLHVICGCSN